MSGTLRFSGMSADELRLEHVAELVGEETRRMEPAVDALLDARAARSGTSSGVQAAMMSSGSVNSSDGAP